MVAISIGLSTNYNLLHNKNTKTQKSIPNQIKILINYYLILKRYKDIML
jgi:hypothetical protein